MILAVCLDPAVEVTSTADTLTAGESHPVGTVTQRAGGVGVNVARPPHGHLPGAGAYGTALLWPGAAALVPGGLVFVGSRRCSGPTQLRRSAGAPFGHDASGCVPEGRGVSSGGVRRPTRCLKRHIAREIYKALTTETSPLETTPDTHSLAA